MNDDIIRGILMEKHRRAHNIKAIAEFAVLCVMFAAMGVMFIIGIASSTY